MARDSPYKRYQTGDKTAMTDEQLRGMRLFKDEGCDICHSGPLFSDYQLHVLSVPDDSSLASSDSGAFETPSLRNVGLTAPYMQNRVFQTLNQVLKFYDDIGGPISQNPHVTASQLDAKIQLIALREPEQAQLIAFLHALSDPSYDRTIVARIPSGLKPGGNIR